MPPRWYGSLEWQVVVGSQYKQFSGLDLAGLDNSRGGVCNQGGFDLGGVPKIYWHSGTAGCHGSSHLGLAEEADVHVGTGCPPSNGCGSVPHWGHFHRCSVNTGVYTFENECISETEWALEWSFYAVADNAKCSTYRSSCPTGYHFDDGAAGVECSAPDTCANDEVEHCCDANDACSTFTCDGGWFSDSARSGELCTQPVCDSSGDLDKCCNECTPQAFCAISDTAASCVGSNSDKYRCTQALAHYGIESYMVHEKQCVRPTGMAAYDFNGPLSESLSAPSFGMEGLRCALGYSNVASGAGAAPRMPDNAVPRLTHATQRCTTPHRVTPHDANLRPCAMDTDCQTRVETHTVAVMNALCPSTHDEDRSPSAVSCSGDFDSNVRLALANGMFAHCGAHCLYDLDHPGIVSYQWTPGSSCWTRESDTCINHSDKAAAVAKAAGICSPGHGMAHMCGGVVICMLATPMHSSSHQIMCSTRHLPMERPSSRANGLGRRRV